MERLIVENNLSRNHIFRELSNKERTDYVVLRSDLDKTDSCYPDYYDVAHITMAKNDDIVGLNELDLLEILRDRLVECCRESAGSDVESEYENVITRLEQLKISVENIVSRRS